MPYFPQLGDIMEAIVYCAGNNQLGENLLHFRVSGIGNGGVDGGIIADAISTLYAPKYLPLISSTATFEGITIQKLAPAPRIVHDTSALNRGPGSGGPGFLPTQVRGLIGGSTGVASKKDRTRVYVPFPPPAANDPGGVPTPAYLASLQLLATTLLAPVLATKAGASTALTPVVWHKATKTVTDLTTMTARTLWATQRRSGAYGRPNQLPF